MKKEFILKLLLILFFTTIIKASTEFEIIFKSNYNNESIFFPTNATKCPMFQKSCKVPILIDTFEINLNEARHFVQSKRFFTLVNIESCENRSTLDIHDCILFDRVNETTKNFTLHYLILNAKIVGKANILIKFEDDNSTIQHDVIVTSPERFLDKFHTVLVIVFQTVISVFMGLLLDTETILKIIKMPIPVVIGFTLQYGGMPLLAFGIIKIFSLTPVDALALFIYACCPGGSASNNWTILFNGDIDLSVIMTFVSTMASLVCMPAWFYTLGREFANAANIKIPFLKLIMNLFTTIGPCLFGLLLVKCFPKMRPFIVKVAKPVTLFTLLTFLVLTIFIKYYAFLLLTWRQWIIPPILPWSSFALSAIIAWFVRLPKPQIYTIALETGIQNVGVAFLIIFYNFPSPEVDYAILPLIIVSFLTFVPLWILFILITIKTKCIDKLLKNNKNTVDIESLKAENEKLKHVSNHEEN